MKTSTGIGAPTPFSPSRRRGRRPGEGALAKIGKWAGGAAIGIGIAAATLAASGSFADDPVERALSLVSQKKYPEARAVLKSLLKREPNAPRVRLLHGILRAREGNAREAIAIFERLRSDLPDMFEPYNNLAVLYAEQGRLDEAHAVLMAALERKRDAVAYANLGDVYMRLADRAYSRARNTGAGGPVSQRIRLSGPDSPASAKAADRPASETAKGGTERAETRLRSTPKVPPAKPAPAAAARPATQAKPSAGAIGDDGPLVLVADPENAGTDGPSESSPAAASGRACAHAGKFKDRKTVARAVEWMQSRGAEMIDLRQKKNRVVKSYRVYLPAFPSADAAAGKLAELRGRGIRDVAIIGKGARANQISLGVFKRKNNMQRRVAQLEKLGYSARWAANAKTLTEYAIRVRTNGTPPDLTSAWGSEFPGQPFEFVDCP